MEITYLSYITYSLTEMNVSSDLVLVNVGDSDSADYYCQATNNLVITETRNSSSAMIIVHCKLKIKRHYLCNATAFMIYLQILLRLFQYLQM